MPEAVGFRGQIKSFLAWLRGWPAGGQMVAVLRSGLLAGCMPIGDPTSHGAPNTDNAEPPAAPIS
jgi:hypothetical protein